MITRIRTLVVASSCSLALASCTWDNCEPPDILPGVYEVTDAADPSLVGSRVRVTADAVVLTYERDGATVNVSYDVGPASDG